MPNAPEAPRPDLGDLFPDVTGPAGAYEDYVWPATAVWVMTNECPPCAHFSARTPG